MKKVLEKYYCQACGRLCSISEVEIFMDFKICDGSDQCRERIKNLPMMFIDDPFEDSLKVDPRYLGKLIRKGFYGSKYEVGRISVLNTAHYKFKSNSLVTIEFANTSEDSPIDCARSCTDSRPLCHHQIKEKSLPDKLLEIEKRLREFDPTTLNGELDITKIRVKRALKLLRKIDKRFQSGEIKNG